MIRTTVLPFSCRLFFVIGSLLSSITIQAQKKWDGGGGDSQWSNAANWSDNTVPVATDDVLLDNTLAPASYTVQLPSIAVTINSLTILPSLPISIQLILPVSNTVIPGFTINGTGGITIGDGGVFINSSGGSPGAAIVVTDSIKIYNGGRFIHNTSNSHAAYISRLSRAPGTEKGVFEFNVPGTASYTISLSGRTYGTFELSAVAAGGVKTYLSNGITTAAIRGDCRINSGVNYTLDFTGDLVVAGSMFVNGNFNMASGPNNNFVKIKQHFFCSGLITESAAGFPVIELNGTANQHVSITGAITNSVTLKMNNPSEATLLSPVSLPYKLLLLSGKINTTSLQLLTLLPNCSIQADSISNTSFIDGPLQKTGLSNADYFLFPVGKELVQRWIELKNASGNFIVEFHKSNPYALSGTMGSGIDHISKIEYWSIDASTGSTAKIELSFDNVNSGGVTDINTLRVSHLVAGNWENSGNNGTTGSAGAAGSVISNNETVFGPASPYFTLAGSEPNENPLPINWLDFTMQSKLTGIQCRWEISRNLHAVGFDIEYSSDGRNFKKIKSIAARENSNRYTEYIQKLTDPIQCYRIHVVTENGSNLYSKVITFVLPPEKIWLTSISTTGSPGHFMLSLSAREKTQLLLHIVNSNGERVKNISLQLYPGNHLFPLPIHEFPAGVYQIFGVYSTRRTNILRFYKP